MQAMNNNRFHELNQSSLIQFSGEDARTFLANLLTCDVASLGTTRSSYGAYCTPKGRVLASFLLWQSEQGYFMQLPDALREPIQKQLSKYILRSKVKATDATASHVILGVSGNDAGALVQHATGQAPRAARDVVHADDMTVIGLPSNRFEIVVAKVKAPRVMEDLVKGAEKSGPELWNWLDIRSGIPTVTPATQDAFVPQMLNLDLLDGVSFEKGCYPGQEIVARMRYRGTLKQRLYLAHLEGDEAPQPGDRLYSAAFGDQACGTILNSARSPEGGHDVLAVMQIAAAEKKDAHWNATGGPSLRFLDLPYPVV
jgi:folate-binding protein YgfZ